MQSIDTLVRLSFDSESNVDILDCEHLEIVQSVGNSAKLSETYSTTLTLILLEHLQFSVRHSSISNIKHLTKFLEDLELLRCV